MGYTIVNEALESHFPKLQTCSKSIEPLSRNRDPNMIQNEYLVRLCDLLPTEADNDVISGRNVKTLEATLQQIMKLREIIFQTDHFATVKLVMAAVA